MPTVIAHRGASGHQPENSLAAFQEARRLGAQAVELDLQVSADGALIIHHDPEVPGLGRIATLTRSALGRYRLPNGEPLPELGDVFRAVPDLEIWIELKSLPAAADESLLATMGDTPESKRYGVHSFDHRIIARLAARRPGLRLGILSASYPADPVGPMTHVGANTLWQAWHLIDQELVEAVHRKGGQLIAWTVNEAETARQLASLGVDGLCGNYPERLRIR